ncbi:ParB/RepB/Spo0J family partition protein [Prosthecobacter sp.]|uniref:ParB/RepB/Spo0J family partition protein n=1 Tax=Prosthecobacter sp. TaxID=1965333 RepID=UPI0037833370
MNEIKLPVVRSLARVMEWEINPRRGVYRGMEELKDSLRREGLQDAIHVWERTDADYLLKGHRRTRGMKELGWTECLQVVHHFEDEREAFAFLLEDHGHTVPLDAEEKIVAIETGVRLGMTTADLAPMMGVTEERAQLWFDLGELLPSGARSALAKGELSVNTAELLLAIADPKKRREAASLILNDPETGEPMAHGQAKAFIQARYVLPEKWHKDWLELEAKLRKKKKVVDGFNYVEWKDRLDFVLGDSGQPQPEFELGESYYPKDPDGRSWEAVAVGLQVPVYVCAAPRHAEGFVTLVNAAMMRDALTVRPAPVGSGEDEDDEELPQSDAKTGAKTESEPDEGGAPVDASEQPSVSLVDENEAERLRVWLKTWLGAIYEHLVSKPTDAMTSGPWRPLQSFLARITTDRDSEALLAWRGITSSTEALEFIASDTKNRAPLRLAILLLLCAESDASDQPQKVIREVAGVLGLDGKKLDLAAEAAAGK